MEKETGIPEQINTMDLVKLNNNSDDVLKINEILVEHELVTNDEKQSDCDSHSEELNAYEEQHEIIHNEHSQFYESSSSSDSKIDYAVKIDDSDTLSDIEDMKTDSADSEDSALGSLPPDTASADREEEGQDRSDGSDSGLGSETNDDPKLPTFDLALQCANKITLAKEEIIDSQNEVDQSPKEVQKPLKSSLKRKCSVTTNLDEPQPKKKKDNIKFDNVTVFYFPRTQGFVCVPSQGGSTLGMEWQHTHTQTFTLAEHALEQRRLHKQLLQQLKNERLTLQGESFSSSEDSDTEEEASDISDSELDLDSYYFLQPVPTRQRRALLRAAGIRKIEAFEKDECRDIRSSREFCGCACKGVCNPEICSCSQAGIKCQVDRLNFPCGCTKDGCSNTAGRIEFNPVRVRTHFIHTLMKLGLEKKNEEIQAKKLWNEANSVNTLANTYDRNQCRIQEDGLLRDVNLTPRLEVESCVNNGSFNNVHCDRNTSLPQLNQPDNHVSYGYSNTSTNHNSLAQHSAMMYDNSSSHCSHGDPYTLNILQGKGPPYLATNIMPYNSMSNNMHNYSCDINSYNYEHHVDNHNYKSSQSFSASSFEEFAHNSQMSMFSHYGHMYVQDYMQKPSTSSQDHNTLQYHNMPPNHYDMYKNSTNCSTQDKSGSHYTTLMALPYYNNENKSQTAENDENWFSHDTLLNLDHSENTTQDASELRAQPTEVQPAEPISNETTENFGELIKKTMVESVSV